MKKITLILFLSMVVVFSAEAHKYKNNHITISTQTFYDQLSPYGDWIYSPDYGYVWRPYFDNPDSFRPYSSNGNWVYTDYGWTWASGYEWGWATFHYGRWDFDNYLGWMWIPGYEWAPAWVSWGSYDNYWGWAPMGPNINVQFGYGWDAPDPWWAFVPRNHFCSSNWNNYIYDRPVRVNHITHITNVYVDANNRNNHDSWYNGPRVNDVEKFSGSKVRRMEVGESQRPEKSGIHNNRLDVYRPTVDSKRNDTHPSEYRNVEQARSGKRIEQTNARTNDPGMNRPRDNKKETRSTNQVPVQRNGNVKSETRVEPRSTQNSNSRNTEVARESKNATRTTTQPEMRSGSVNKNTRVEPRNESQASPQRNSTRPSVEPSRVENKGNSQSQTNSPSRVNVNSNSSREQGNKRATSTQPSREQRTNAVTPPSNSRNQNTGSKQVAKEEVKKAVTESKRTIENSDKRASEKPSNR
jgi:hypothetical protein